MENLCILLTVMALFIERFMECADCSSCTMYRDSVYAAHCDCTIHGDSGLVSYTWIKHSPGLNRAVYGDVLLKIEFSLG